MADPGEGSSRQAQQLESDEQKRSAEREQPSAYLTETFEEKMSFDGSLCPAVPQEEAEEPEDIAIGHDGAGKATKYAYKPLEGRKIRVLLLWPAETWDAPIKCTMEELDLPDAPTPEQSFASDSEDESSGTKLRMKPADSELPFGDSAWFDQILAETCFSMGNGTFNRDPHRAESTDGHEEIRQQSDLYQDLGGTEEQWKFRNLERLAGATYAALHPAESGYTALSYSWATEDGDATADKLMQLDESQVAITTNLYDALLRLRSELDGRPLRLWVDAVCINQADLDEKNHQVAMFGQIYSWASRVIAWLGASGNGYADHLAHEGLRCLSADAMEFYGMERGSRAKRAYRNEFALRHAWTNQEPNMTFNKNNTQRWAYVAQLRQCPACADRDPALTAQICSSGEPQSPGPLERRFLSRRWVVQEMTLSRPGGLWFKWGSCTMSQMDFVGAAKRYDDLDIFAWFSPRLPKAWTTIKGPGVVAERWFSYTSLTTRLLTRCVPGVSLVHLMGAVDGTACSDPRDRVYSLLAMASPEHQIEADYRCTPVQTFVQFASLLIRSHHLYTIFLNHSGAERRPLDGVLRGLPSWVPNLSQGFRQLEDKHVYAGSSHDIQQPEYRGRELKHLKAQCEAVCSSEGVLSISLYQHGTIGGCITKEDPQDKVNVVQAELRKDGIYLDCGHAGCRQLDPDKSEHKAKSRTGSKPMWDSNTRFSITATRVKGDRRDGKRTQTENYKVCIHDGTSFGCVGTSKLYGLASPPKPGDVLCTIYPRDGGGEKHLQNCCILRPVPECELEGALEIVGFLYHVSLDLNRQGIESKQIRFNII